MRLILSLLLALIPTATFAHTGHGDTAGLLHGFMHPLGGLDHLLAMLAVGVFAFVLGRAALVPLAFVSAMVVGFLLGTGGVGLPFVELGIGLSSIVIGAAAASGKQIPVAAAMSLVGAFAIFHGHAHGAEMPAGAAGLDYALGFIAATVLLHAAGIAAAMGTTRLSGRFGRPLAQAAGGLFALGGIGALAGWI
jgi:urease accessory protein